MPNDPQHARIGIRIPPWLGYGREIFQGIGRYMSENNLQWQVDTAIEADGELRSLIINEDWEGDGAIFFRYTKEEAEKFVGRGMPLVSVSRESPCDWVPRVHPDNYAIGALAAEHLMGCGSPNLACWFDPHRSYASERLDGFRQRASEFGRDVLVIETPVSDYPEKSKREMMNDSIQTELKKLPLPVAVFCRDDILASAILREARKLKIETPVDLIVLGVGNDPVLSSVSLPKLSSVTLPGKQIGWCAAEMLHRALQEGQGIDASKPAEVVELPVQTVVRRQSTDHLHTPDELVAKACERIRMSLGKEKITVQQLCVTLEISNTTLLQRFQAAVGCSPKQFIDRVRHEEAVRLLLQTAWSIKEIAYELGFRSPEEFDRFFKRISKIAPGRFRDTRE